MQLLGLFTVPNLVQYMENQVSRECVRFMWETGTKDNSQTRALYVGIILDVWRGDGSAWEVR